LRLVVVLVLFLAASGVSLLIYLITNRGEKGSFESSYDAAAEKVLGKSVLSLKSSIMPPFAIN